MRRKRLIDDRRNYSDLLALVNLIIGIFMVAWTFSVHLECISGEPYIAPRKASQCISWPLV